MNLLDFQRQFPDDATCIAFLEKQRWGENGEKRFCPHCGATRTYKYASGKLYKCGECRKQFTATVGTIFEGSHIPLQKWFYAAFLNTSLKKGISSIQLAKYLGITQKSAWFMLQRIRYGLETSGNRSLLGNVVEIDEAYVGGAEKNKHADKRIEGTRGRGSQWTKAPIVGMLERQGNLKLLTTHFTDTPTMHALIQMNVQPGTTVMSDNYLPYRTISKLGYISMRVDHAHGEYVRGDIHSNGIENSWTHLKLSLRAIYMGVSRRHLQLYCAEFSFRFNRRDMDDGARFMDWFDYCNGRLTYKRLISGRSIRAL